MGSVHLIAAENGQNIVKQIKKSLSGSVAVKSTMLKGNMNLLVERGSLNPADVFVLVITECALKRLNDSSENCDQWLQALLKDPRRVFVLYSCSQNVKQDAELFFGKQSVQWTTVKRVDTNDRRQWFLMEAEVKILLDESPPVVTQKRDKFVLQPDTITSLVGIRSFILAF